MNSGLRQLLILFFGRLILGKSALDFLSRFITECFKILLPYATNCFLRSLNLFNAGKILIREWFCTVSMWMFYWSHQGKSELGLSIYLCKILMVLVLWNKEDHYQHVICFNSDYLFRITTSSMDIRKFFCFTQAIPKQTRLRKRSSNDTISRFQPTVLSKFWYLSNTGKEGITPSCLILYNFSLSFFILPQFFQANVAAMCCYSAQQSVFMQRAFLFADRNDLLALNLIYLAYIIFFIFSSLFHVYFTFWRVPQKQNNYF